jgi:hypothetical protein
MMPKAFFSKADIAYILKLFPYSPSIVKNALEAEVLNVEKSPRKSSIIDRIKS